MKKKIIALILCVLMMVTVFTACNNTPTESKTESTASTASTASTVESDPVQDVALVRYGNPDQYRDSAAVDVELNKILNDKYGVNLTQKWLSDYSATVQLKVSTKEEGLDVFWCNGGTLTDALVKANGLYDFSKELKNYKGLYESIPENVWASFSYGNGEIYHIPCYKESAVGCDFLMNAEKAEALGLDFSKYDMNNRMTIDDISDVLKVLADSGEFDYVFHPGAYTIQYAREYVMQDELAAITPYLGLDLTNSDQEIVNLVETDAFADYLAATSSWVQNGYIYSDMLVADQAVLIYENCALASGSVGASVWCRVPDGQANADDRYSCKTVLVPITDTMMNNTTALGSAYAIPVYTKNLDATLTLMQAIYTDLEVADLVCFGIEGTHYDLEDGRVVRKSDVGYGADPWSCVNVMCVSLKKGESEDKAEQYAAFNEAANLSPLCGFHADFTGLEAEKAACDATVSTYEKTLCAGFSTDDITLEKYRAELKANGVDKIVEAIQKQYADWLASK